MHQGIFGLPFRRLKVERWELNVRPPLKCAGCLKGMARVLMLSTFKIQARALFFCRRGQGGHKRTAENVVSNAEN